MKYILFYIWGAFFLIFSALSADLSKEAPTSVVKTAHLYSVDFHNSDFKASDGISVNLGPGVFYNKTDLNSWLMHYSGASYIEFEFTLRKKSGQFFMNLIHLSALVGDKFYSPIKITVNQKPLKEKYIPDSPQWISEQFDMSQYIKNGKNKVKIEFLSDAIGNYWIHHFSVDLISPESQ